MGDSHALRVAKSIASKRRKRESLPFKIGDFVTTGSSRVPAYDQVEGVVTGLNPEDGEIRVKCVGGEGWFAIDELTHSEGDSVDMAELEDFEEM